MTDIQKNIYKLLFALGACFPKAQGLTIGYWGDAVYLTINKFRYRFSVSALGLVERFEDSLLISDKKAQAVSVKLKKFLNL